MTNVFCFPYAGAGFAAYRPWRASAPKSIKLCPVELPGREGRFRDRLITDAIALADDLTARLLPALTPPFGFFGHSMGALLSFLVTRNLRRQRGPMPRALVVSGRFAPHRPDPNPPAHKLSDPAFQDYLRDLGGTTPQILANRELMEIMRPIVRADFTVCETYRYQDESPLDVPITALGGTDDPLTSIDDLRAWRAQTTGDFREHLFSGDHFFINQHVAEVLAILASSMT